MYLPCQGPVVARLGALTIPDFAARRFYRFFPCNLLFIYFRNVENEGYQEAKDHTPKGQLFPFLLSVLFPENLFYNLHPGQAIGTLVSTDSILCLLAIGGQPSEPLETASSSGGLLTSSKQRLLISSVPKLKRHGSQYPGRGAANAKPRDSNASHRVPLDVKSWPLRDVNVEYLDILARYGLVRRYVLDVVDDIEAFNSSAENGVLLVKPGLRRESVSCSSVGQAGSWRRGRELTVLVVVMKNWLPLVFGPALAMLTVYGWSCCRVVNSSSKGLPHMLWPPWPFPHGSPVWIINFLMTRWNFRPL